MSDPGLEKAAILMLALGEDGAAEVMRYLGAREVKKLSEAMATMKNVAAGQLQTTLSSFREVIQNTSPINVATDEYIRNVLTRALGDDKASALLNRLLESKDPAAIENLKWMEADAVADLIRNEPPQIIATILVHLDRQQACEILDLFSEQLRNDVVLRIATLDGVQPEALRDLNEVLTNLLAGNDSGRKKQMGGVRATAEILNFLSGDAEASAMEALKQMDNEMAQAIVDEMFVFENILAIDDRGIQLILKEVQSESLIIALKGSSQEMRDKVFANMSQRAAEMMREDLESKGPVRLSEVEAQQKEILAIVRRLADENQIVLGSKGGDQFV